MTSFSYIAINKQGNKIEGTADTSNRNAVISDLIKQGLRPISVKNYSSKGISLNMNLFTRKKVKTETLVVFTRELSTMVGAGVPLARALASIEKHSESPALKIVLGSVLKSVEGGESLGNALGNHPQIFNDIYVNMVRAGETAGILDEILKRLALQEEKNASIKKKIKSAMAYPMVLLFIVIVAFFGLMLFVIPSIGNIIKSLSGSDTQLPLITQVMLNISGFFVHYWYIIFAVIITSVILVRRFIKTPKGRYFLHSLMLKIPVLKAVIIKIVVARFARTFSALMGAGVPVLESLSVTANSLGNDVYRKTLLEARDKIKNGSQLSSILEDNPLFPPIVSQMLSVGEETGQTENVLVKVADFYEEEVDASINGLSSIIEPIMIVFLGTMVGLIAASVMLPIASMSQSIH